MKRVEHVWPYSLLVLFFLTALSSTAGSPPVDLSPTSFNFGQQNLYTTSGANTATLTNHLNTDLAILSITVSGDFALTSNCSSVLAAGHSCTIKIYFTPTVIGSRTGTVTVVDSDSSSPQTIGLSGTGSVQHLVSVSVTPSNPSVPLGIGQQFIATGLFKDGSTQILTTAVVWSSSATSVATTSNAVGSQGLASSVTQGTATITAAADSIIGSATLTVKPPALVSLAVTPANPSIFLGKTLQFAATGNYTDGSTKNLTTSVTWSSSISAVATISNTPGSQGLASSVAQGTTTITASTFSASGSQVSASTILTVNPPPTLVSIAITPANASIFVGRTQQFNAIGTFTDGSTQDVTTSMYWFSSTTAVATISNSPGSQGLATGVAQGTTAIYANPLSGTPHITPHTTLSVLVPTLVSVSVTPANPTILVGSTVQFTATGSYSDGSTKDLTTQVIWSTSNPVVATISMAQGHQGLATGLAPGTTTIGTDGGALSNSATLAVSSPVPGIVVRPALVSIPMGDAVQFTAATTFPNGSTLDQTTAVTWSSSNPAVATISNSPGTQGRATSVALGTTTITATEGSLIGSTSLTVTPLVPGQARFAYVTNEYDSTISMYLVDNSTGLLAPYGTTSLGSGGAFPHAVTADPLGKVLYLANSGPPFGNGNITGYSIDSAAGILTPISGSSVFAYPVFALAVHPSGQFLFAATGGSVATYSINVAGALAFVGYAIAPSPTSVAVDPSGKFVYAANVNNNNVSAFTFDSTTGALTPVPGSPFPAGANPESAAVHPSGKFLYAPNGNGQSVSAYAIDSTTGALTPAPGSPFAAGIIPAAIAFSPAGNFAYVGNGGSNNVSAFTVNATTGALLPVAGSPFPTGNGSFAPMVDPLGKFLYGVNFLGNDVAMFAIDTTSGALTNLGTAPAGNLPSSMVLVK